jgi:hypothetical protein
VAKPPRARSSARSGCAIEELPITAQLVALAFGHGMGMTLLNLEQCFYLRGMEVAVIAAADRILVPILSVLRQ